MRAKQSPSLFNGLLLVTLDDGGQRHGLVVCPPGLTDAAGAVARIGSIFQGVKQAAAGHSADGWTWGDVIEALEEDGFTHVVPAGWDGAALKDGANRVLPVRAEIHTADHAEFLEFDAAEWFERATDAEITSLKERGDWAGDYALVQVAETCRRRQDGLDAFILTLGDDKKFDCHVSPEDAARWIRVNRPELFTELWPGGTDDEIDWNEVNGSPRQESLYHDLWG